MNSTSKSRDRSSDDLRRVEPYKRSTKDKQSWTHGRPAPTAKWPEEV